MTMNEVTVMMRELSRVFDVVRLVDCAMTTQYTAEASGNLVKGEHKCYTVWNKDRRCDNCISAKALSQKNKVTKCEFRDGDVCFVVADYLEVDEVPYVLEVVTRITDDLMIGAFGKENFIDCVEEYNRKLYTDALTGAYNREYYEEQLVALLGNRALVMADLDNFKQINDTFGHEAGDTVLKKVSELFMEDIGNEGTVVRYGGDEFLLVFNDIAADAFLPRLDALRKAVAGMTFDRYPELRVTVSIGGSLPDCCSLPGCCSLPDGGTLNRISVADSRMYKAKATKNAVIIQD